MRRSVDSSVTIPFDQTFRNLDLNSPDSSQLAETDRFNYCGCGWPQHLFVPRGTPGGYSMDLFAMITDYEQDKVRLKQLRTIPFE